MFAGENAHWRQDNRALVDAAKDAEIFMRADGYEVDASFRITAIWEAQGFMARVKCFVGSHISDTLLKWGAAVLRPYMACAKALLACADTRHGKLLLL
jgi:hypothetical protein